MTTFQQQHDGRLAQAVPCKGSKPGSIPGRAFNTQIAQLAEQQTENLRVAGSIPAPWANFSTEGRIAGVLIDLENRDDRNHSCRVGSTPAPSAIFSTLGHVPRPATEPPKLSAVGSIPTPSAIFNGTLPELVKDLVANQRSTLAGGAGSSPAGSAIFMRVRLLLVVGRQIVNLLIRNTVGSIPTARTTLKTAVAKW
jgi:hypothetical protein